MHASPAGNPYPRIYFNLAFVVFTAVLLWRFCLSAIKRVRDERRSAALGVTSKPDLKASIGGYALVALMFVYLLVSAAVDIFKAWPK